MERARTGLQKIIKDTLRRAPADEAPIMAWPVVCGAAIAAKSRAMSFADGCLQVEVPDAAWRNELLHFVPQYLSALNAITGVVVNRIEFVLPGEMIAGR
jgi:Dna[CI] antecedent, DciA